MEDIKNSANTRLYLGKAKRDVPNGQERRRGAGEVYEAIS